MDTVSLPASHETEVAIVGSGPVGLLLGCLLCQRGIDCVLLERKQNPALQSRAIGIHPPARAVLAKVGVADKLIQKGVRIQGGQVFYGASPMGRLALLGEDAFALSVPQTVTESLLERRLYELAPHALHRGIEVRDVIQESGKVNVSWCGTNGGKGTVRARFVVGCDGKGSAVRQSMGIHFSGGAYCDTYLMGDFADRTSFGTDAAMFLSSGGIVESFPLPDAGRRWVARLPKGERSLDIERLAELVVARTGHSIPLATCRWSSGFGIEHFLAESFMVGNVVLAGDSAHVVSPIGGQGMNLGFLDAGDLADCLHPILRSDGDPSSLLNGYETRRRRAAQIILRRAYGNTLLARPCLPFDPRRAFVWAILNLSPLSSRFARLFTMRD